MFSLREIISVIVFIGLAGLFWFSLSGVLAGAGSYYFIAAAFILFAAAGTVSTVLIRAFSSFLVSFTGAAILFLIFFGPNVANLAGIALAAAALLPAFPAAKKEEKNSLKISFSRLSKIFLPPFLTAIFLLFSLAFYSSPVAQKGTELLLPKSLFESSFKLLQAPLSGFLPFKLTPEMTADEAVLLYALSGLAKEGGTLPIKYSSELMAAAKAKNISLSGSQSLEKILADQELAKILLVDLQTYLAKNPKMLAELRQGASRGLGIELKGGEKISDILYGLATAKTEGFIGPYKQYIPAITAVLLFLTLKSAGSLFAAIFAGIASLILQALLKLDVIIIQERDVKKEIIL